MEGAMVLGGKLDGKYFLSLVWTEKNILKALYAFQNIVFVVKK